MQAQPELRVRKRLPCTLNLATRRHEGMVLNLSSRGLFVQTSLPAEPGTLLDLDVRDPVRGQAIPLQAAVVWRRRVSPLMTGTNQSGMGLRLLSDPAEWRSLMSDLLDTEPPTRGTSRPEPTSTTPATSASKPAARPDPSFEVRLAQSGGPRSRRMIVQSKDESMAARDALDAVGDGWTVLEVRRRPAKGGAVSS